MMLIAERRTKGTFHPGAVNTIALDLNLPTRSEAIGPAVKLVTDLMKGYTENKNLTRYELAIDEAIRNAYEHGNLGISMEEKEQLLESDGFEKELRQREKQAAQDGKSIRVSLRFSDEGMTCTIEDNGEGFDWRNHEKAEFDVDALTSLNGRGVTLIRKIFDGVEYNDKGNQVTLRKNMPLA